MRIILFLSIIFLPYHFIQAELAEDQIKMLEEQEKTYGDIPDREVQYYEETAPKEMDQQHDFLLKDHPLQENPIPNKQVE